MPQRAAQVFAERVAAGDIGDAVEVVYRVDGGMPSQRVSYRVAVGGAGGADVEAHDVRASSSPRRASLSPDDLDVSNLFAQISAGLHSLTPAEESTFTPDGLVGSLTVRVGDDEATFYFVPEQEKRRSRGQTVAPSMERALEQLWSIATATARRGEESARE